MNGMQQGMLEASRELGALGGRVVEVGGQHVGGWEVAWIVLGLLLWVAAMTALVMGIIALARYLRGPKDNVSTADIASDTEVRGFENEVDATKIDEAKDDTHATT